MCALLLCWTLQNTKRTRTWKSCPQNRTPACYSISNICVTLCLLVCGIMCRSAGPCPSDFPSHFLLQVCGEYFCVSITCGAVPHPAETPWYCRGSQGNKRPVESVVTRQYFPYVIKLMWCWSSEHGHTGYHPKRMINYCISVGWVTCRHTRLILSLNIVDILNDSIISSRNSLAAQQICLLPP